MLNDNLKPLNANLIICPVFKEQETDWGFQTSTKKEVESSFATVISVGADCKHVKEGDTIIYRIPDGAKLTKWNTETGKAEDVRGLIDELLVIAIVEE